MNLSGVERLGSRWRAKPRYQEANLSMASQASPFESLSLRQMSFREGAFLICTGFIYCIQKKASVIISDKRRMWPSGWSVIIVVMRNQHLHTGRINWLAK